MHEYLKRAEAAKVSWPLPDGWDDTRLEAALYPGSEAKPQPQKSPPDFAMVPEQLRSHRHVTMQLLWEENREANPDGYRYSRFCELYQRWRKKLAVVMRQEHKAGEKAFIDWAGSTIPIYDRVTGVVWQASLFVAALGARSCTWAEATRDQQMEAWLRAHIHAFDYWGDVPALAVPDNTKTGVSKAHRYDPDVNPTYHNLAVHYGFGVLPARPYKPRDKAVVESAVQVAQRWTIAALRRRKFFSLEEANQAISELLYRLNHRPFRERDGSRASVFEALDKPALKPLPSEIFDKSHGRGRGSISTITWPSMPTYTVFPTTWSMRWWRSARRRRRWKSCTRARGWLRTCAAAAEGKPSPITNTGPKATRPTWSGHRRAWCSGRRKSGLTPRNCSSG